MKKFTGLFLFLSTLALSLNYYGHQTIANRGATYLFTAPASGTYFINGQLSLPHSYANGNLGNSAAIAQVSKNGVTILYTGVAGANGFALPQVTLVSNDSISMTVTSNASIDQGINAIRGDVFFGSKF